MEQFLQDKIPLRHLLYEETLFLSWRRSAIKEVNDWVPDISLGERLMFQSSVWVIFPLNAWFLSKSPPKGWPSCSWPIINDPPEYNGWNLSFFNEIFSKNMKKKLFIIFLMEEKTGCKTLLLFKWRIEYSISGFRKCRWRNRSLKVSWRRQISWMINHQIC